MSRIYGSPEKAAQLQKRTKQFALRVLALFRALPRTDEARVIGRQLLRSGTSVGANYRAVCRARSRKEFVSKMSIVVEEADESVFWLELLIEGKILPLRKSNCSATKEMSCSLFSAQDLERHASHPDQQTMIQ